MLKFILALSLLSACTKSEEQDTRGVAVTGSASDSITFVVDPSKAQATAAPGEFSIAGTSIQFPPGSFSEAVTITLSEGISLSNEYLDKIYLLDQSYQVNASAVAVELRPKNNIAVASPYTLTIPIPEGEGELVVLFKGVKEDGSWAWGLVGSNNLTENTSTVSFDASYLGRYQAVKLATGITEDQSLKDPGAGPWYGYEFDLYSEFTAPDEDGPDHVYSLFTGLGVIDEFKTNNTPLIPAPSFSFPDLLIEDSVTVFDSSTTSAMAPAIFSSDFDYGIQLEARTRENIITSRILQRTPSTTLPTESVDWSTLTGDYAGETSTAKVSSGTYSVDTVTQDSLELSFENQTVALSGTINGSETSASLQTNTGAVASTLGFIQGTLSLGGTTYTSYGFLSPNRKALALILCPSSSSCPVGDGTGSYGAENLILSLFTKQK